MLRLLASTKAASSQASPKLQPALRIAQTASFSTSLLFQGTRSNLSHTHFAPTPTNLLKPFHPLAPTPHALQFTQHRHAVANFRPRRLKYKKAQKGFWPIHSGGSLRGSTVYYGDYGLQALEGGRLSDRQLDAARTGIRRVIKSEKGSRFFLRCFPDRPVTSKGAETRMGKGKGAVDYFATFVAEGRVVFEVKGVRKELAEKAMRVAAACLPVRTKFVSEEDQKTRMAPRVLPFFVQRRLRDNEFLEYDAAKEAAGAAGAFEVTAAAAAGTSGLGKVEANETATRP
ncbi:ribosomal protein L16p/L10e-domain-containing protein [Fimicolochytrium jonesii]|uniref:ribosomal protein L16p/L10e-domain-containing protein n=1 Tax=Fimicolochytrium jonesii TaxID=1396493 RepID=UPI0022FEE227|nr:ribosomal protein L16p/L10e-domain-containing protein [Fimicolochytrium jonesii]KAI8820864.1 ribosomal protein L16p/L10e-domain-containing protein [Fimicolochytrium jonesii]